MTRGKATSSPTQEPASAAGGAALPRDSERALECARAAIEKKAENVRVLDLRRLSGFADYFVICSATSDRQVQAIADEVIRHCKTHGARPIATEGYEDARWVLVDYGDVVVHVFVDALREYYGLEQLWAAAPRVAVPSEFYGPGVTRIS
ncbi:MAG: ribosome silencing factor [Bdellovibrionales bacterium]|nr:ribosome silencing factor [Bdellovibrionales bacterium]